MTATAMMRERGTGLRALDQAAILADRVATVVARMSRQRRIRRDRNHLHSMPDYLLKDIGITRLDIDRAVMLGRGGGDDRGARVAARRGSGE